MYGCLSAEVHAEKARVIANAAQGEADNVLELLDERGGTRRRRDSELCEPRVAVHAQAREAALIEVGRVARAEVEVPHLTGEEGGAQHAGDAVPCVARDGGLTECAKLKVVVGEGELGRGKGS